MPDVEQLVGTSFVLLAYLAEKSKKTGQSAFPREEVMSDFRKIRTACKDTHLLDPDVYLNGCLDALKNPLSLVDYDAESISICQLGVAFGEKRKIPGNCRRYISKEWGN